MNRDEAIELLQGGTDGVQKWNRVHQALRNTDDLTSLILDGADLSGAKMKAADFSHVDLSGVRFDGADLRFANLFAANMLGASLKESLLQVAQFKWTRLDGVDFSGATVGFTSFLMSDLSDAKNLDSIVHRAPSFVDIQALNMARGRIPSVFLKGCGFSDWQIRNAKLFNPELSAAEFDQALYDVAFARNSGPLVLGGVFISYSHADSRFVDKLERRLEEMGIPVWRDIHDAVAGPFQRQLDKAIWARSAVLVVLSEKSVSSDWVMHEVKTARRREIDESRDVLCPVAVDESWKKLQADVNWAHLTDKNVLDFSAWRTKKFEPQFQKLTKGLSIFYSRESDTDS